MTNAQTSEDGIVRGHLEEIYAHEIEEFNMLLKACRTGFGQELAPDGRFLIDFIESEFYSLPIELTVPLSDQEGSESIVQLDHSELRSYRMEIGRSLVEQVRANDSGLALAEASGPYRRLLLLVRQSHIGYGGVPGFELEDLGITREERRRWDLAECTASDFIADFYDDLNEYRD